MNKLIGVIYGAKATERTIEAVDNMIEQLPPRWRELLITISEDENLNGLMIMYAGGITYTDKVAFNVLRHLKNSIVKIARTRSYEVDGLRQEHFKPRKTKRFARDVGVPFVREGERPPHMNYRTKPPREIVGTTSVFIGGMGDPR